MWAKVKQAVVTEEPAPSAWDVADVDKLRKEGLSESECRTVVYQLVGEFGNAYRYFGS